MTSSATISDDPEVVKQTTQSPASCLKLKGSLVPMTVLELWKFDENKVSEELGAKTAQAPGFFENLPVIIDLEKLPEDETVSFARLIEICDGHSIKVVAVRGGSENHQMLAKACGLGVLAKQSVRSEKPQKAVTAAEESDNTPQAESASSATQAQSVETVEVVKEVVKTVVQNQRQQSKVIHHPIRSGQQVYAADGDLIILASVSAGAEILADGNIHVYGALRGRALAGVKGDTNARIFCQSMQAELVSVAGQYKISEDINRTVIGKPSQVYLDNDSLTFKKLEL